MNTPAAFNDKQRENLIAYLDGELDEQSALEIEQTLAESPAARREVESLTRTWELLDDLPQVSASSEFAEKTLSTLKAESGEVTTLRTAALPQPWKGTWPIVLAAGLLMAAAIGFLVADRWFTPQSEALIRNLPLIEKLETYQEVGDVEFLRRLQHVEGIGRENPPRE